MVSVPVPTAYKRVPELPTVNPDVPVGGFVPESTAILSFKRVLIPVISYPLVTLAPVISSAKLLASPDAGGLLNVSVVLAVSVLLK